MATGEDTVCISSNGISLKSLQITFLCLDSFTTWRRFFIKRGRYPIHRTLHEAFGARHPSSVTPRWGAPASPRGKPRGRCTNSPGILQNRDCLLQPLSRCGGSSPFRGAFSRCPLWGKCREAAKGVPMVFLSCYHSSDNTPSVSPYGLPAPPLGSRV